MGSRKTLLDAAEVLESLDNQGELRALVKSLRCMADRKPPEGAVRVRVAVAIDGEGRWNASGWSAALGDDARDVAVDGLEGDGGYIVHHIEADVPLPVKQTIEAEVA